MLQEFSPLSAAQVTHWALNGLRGIGSPMRKVSVLGRKVCAVFLWLFACAGAGILAAIHFGGHGSLMYVGVGVIVGVPGAIANYLLLGAAWYGKQSSFRRVVILSTVAAGPAPLALLWAAATEPNDGSISG